MSFQSLKFRDFTKWHLSWSWKVNHAQGGRKNKAQGWWCLDFLRITNAVGKFYIFFAFFFSFMHLIRIFFNINNDLFHIKILFITLMFWCRFQHPDRSLLALSELFISEITSHINAIFGGVLKKFDKNLEVEGLKAGEATFGETPFSCFSITRDFSCFPHDDPTDYGFGFIVWLYPGKAS